MAHVVESGSGLSNANAYLSAADADAYFADHGAPAEWTGVQSVKEQALRMGTQYLDAKYGDTWRGTRSTGLQALDWPRQGVQVDGYYLDASPLPEKLEQACAEAALRYLIDGDLLPDVTSTGGIVQSQSVTVGPISSSTTYSSGVSTQIKWYRKVDLLVRSLTLGGSTVIRG